MHFDPGLWPGKDYLRHMQVTSFTLSRA